MAVEVFVKYQIIHKQWEGTAVLLVSAGFTTKKQAPKDNISQALFHPPTFFFFFSTFKRTERGRSFQGWLASRSRLSHACLQGTKSGQSIGHRNKSVRRCCLSRCVHAERNLPATRPTCSLLLLCFCPSLGSFSPRRGNEAMSL